MVFQFVDSFVYKAVGMSVAFQVGVDYCLDKLVVVINHQLVLNRKFV